MEQSLLNPFLLLLNFIQHFRHSQPHGQDNAIGNLETFIVALCCDNVNYSNVSPELQLAYTSERGEEGKYLGSEIILMQPPIT